MYQRMRFESDHRASWQKVNSFPFVLTPIDAEDSPGILSFPSYSPRGIEEEDRVPSRSRIRFLNKRLGVCSAQGTGRGERFDWRIEVEQCDSSAIVLEEEITREMGGGGGRVVGSTEFRERAERIRARERERERESLLQTSGRRDVMMMERRKRRSRDFFFWIPKETIREYDVQLLVVEEVYNVLIIYSWQE